MSEQHDIDAILYVANGWTVTCRCGWSSRTHGDPDRAANAHLGHATGREWWED